LNCAASTLAVLSRFSISSWARAVEPGPVRDQLVSSVDLALGFGRVELGQLLVLLDRLALLYQPRDLGLAAELRLDVDRVLRLEVAVLDHRDVEIAAARLEQGLGRVAVGARRGQPRAEVAPTDLPGPRARAGSRCPWLVPHPCSSMNKMPRSRTLPDAIS
jgi:hypothetical protein